MPVSRFGIQNLETLCLSANVVLKFGNAAFNEFGAAKLETLCLSTDLVFNVWKHCACQPMWCSEFWNVAFLNEFGVTRLETLCVSRDLVFNVSKRCACQRI